MVPNLETGGSFRGAQLYYLHDKRKEGELLRLSDDRIAWTATRNCAHDDPELAFDEMIATAHDQEQLKLAAGGRLSGRPSEKPVMTISLAWHPSEKPDREHMTKAADAYLRFMGWDDHQAVYVAHDDTQHCHVHIILNRVHPETGRLHDDSFSKNRSQVWARDYEHEHGRIWCEERIGKDYSHPNDRTPHGLPHREAVEAREEANHYAVLEEAAHTLDDREKELLARHHQAEREAFFETRHQQFREAREGAYREIRDEYKEQWADYFHQAAAARHQAQRDSADMATRIMHFAREGNFAAAWDALTDRQALSRTVEHELSQQRTALRAEQRADTRERQDEACAALYDQRALTYTEIKQRQKDERAELKDLQAARDEQRPYDQQRLLELLAEPSLADRPAQVAAELQHETRTDADRRADHDLVTQAARDSPDIQAQLEPERAETGQPTPREISDGPGDKHPRRDVADAIAGGIAKAAEIIGKVIEAFISPETPQEKAGREALARVLAETAPEREAAAEQHVLDQRQAAYEQQKSAYDKFDEYFAQHGDRLRREEEHRKRKKDHDRDR